VRRTLFGGAVLFLAVAIVVALVRPRILQALDGPEEETAPGSASQRL